MVILDILPLSKFERVVTMGEDNGRKLVLIVQEVTAVKVCDGHLMLTPKEKCTE